MDALEKAIEAEIDDIITNGITADEVIRAKERMVAEAVFARDSLSGGARTLGAAVASGLSVEDVERWPDNIATVTAEQINEAAKALVNKNRSVTGLLLPSSES